MRKYEKKVLAITTSMLLLVQSSAMGMGKEGKAKFKNLSVPTLVTSSNSSSIIKKMKGKKTERVKLKKIEMDPLYSFFTNKENADFEYKEMQGEMVVPCLGVIDVLEKSMKINVLDVDFSYIARDVSEINKDNNCVAGDTIVEKIEISKGVPVSGRVYIAPNFHGAVFDLRLWIKSNEDLIEKAYENNCFSIRYKNMSYDKAKKFFNNSEIDYALSEYIVSSFKEGLKDHPFIEISETTGNAENVSPGIISIYGDSIKCSKSKLSKGIYGLGLQIRMNSFGREESKVLKESLLKIKKNVGDRFKNIENLQSKTKIITKVKNKKENQFGVFKGFDKSLNLILVGGAGRIARAAFSRFLQSEIVGREKNNSKTNIFFAYEWYRNKEKRKSFLKGFVEDVELPFYYEKNKSQPLEVVTEDKNNFLIVKKKTISCLKKDVLFRVEFKNKGRKIVFRDKDNNIIVEVCVIADKSGKYYRSLDQVNFQGLEINKNIPTCIYSCTGGNGTHVGNLKSWYRHFKNNLGEKVFVYTSAPYKVDAKDNQNGDLIKIYSEHAKKSTIIYGINHMKKVLSDYKQDMIFSGGSCTTNSLVGILMFELILNFELNYPEKYLEVKKKMDAELKTEYGDAFEEHRDLFYIFYYMVRDYKKLISKIDIIMETTHSVTKSQDALLNVKSKTQEAINAIQASSTGAAKAVAKVLGDVLGSAVFRSTRVPQNIGSVVNLSVRSRSEKELSEDEYIKKMKQAIDDNYGFKAALGYSNCINSLKDVVNSKSGGVVDLESIRSRYDKENKINYRKTSIFYDNENSFLNQNLNGINSINNQMHKEILLKRFSSNLSDVLRVIDGGSEDNRKGRKTYDEDDISVNGLSINDTSFSINDTDFLIRDNGKTPEKATSEWLQTLEKFAVENQSKYGLEEKEIKVVFAGKEQKTISSNKWEDLEKTKGTISLKQSLADADLNVQKGAVLKELADLEAKTLGKFGKLTDRNEALLWVEREGRKRFVLSQDYEFIKLFVEKLGEYVDLEDSGAKKEFDMEKAAIEFLNENRKSLDNGLDIDKLLTKLETSQGNDVAAYRENTEALRSA